MIELEPIEYSTANDSFKGIYFVYAVTRIVVYFLYTVFISILLYKVLRKIYKKRNRQDYTTDSYQTTRDHTVPIIYLFSIIFLFSRFVAAIISIIDNVRYDPESVTHERLLVAYYSLLVVGTSSNFISWFEIGYFWILTFYLFYGTIAGGDLYAINPRARIIVDRCLKVTVSILTLVMVAIVIALNVKWESHEAIDMAYYIVFLGFVLFAGVLFSYHGHHLTQALKSELGKANFGPHEAKKQEFSASIIRITYLVRLLAIMVIIVIAKTVVLVFLFKRTFGASTLDDFISFVIEMCQTSTIILAVHPRRAKALKNGSDTSSGSSGSNNSNKSKGTITGSQTSKKKSASGRSRSATKSSISSSSSNEDKSGVSSSNNQQQQVVIELGEIESSSSTENQQQIVVVVEPTTSGDLDTRPCLE
ncbi:hypothetical protein DFA_01756 [Cavenderia fasciculata]|uniref:THH1/TOM1/TOM3 domain-containing protein n=1 Tax=Cavenderia fasciculata TaxID=261658 RepID=F4PUK6_CACFS|nr:uncharacterized protein DFA_01756 [Cavenderia fasciculata]EGG21870.1 hypothetical protein DFA_01756 [Cavenderia fasciculata]|eukprot:XP_004359721.1 hypothetical protein DFA_01756 [Cavenderia fasciculata]